MTRIRKFIPHMIAASVVAGLPVIAHADSPMDQQMKQIQAEAQSNIARAFSEANQALTQLDNGPVAPEKIKVPHGVKVAAPEAPRAKPLPKIDLSKLPAQLRRPVTIKWNGPVSGALKKIAQQIGYSYVPSKVKAPSQPTVVLDQKGAPAAVVLQDIGARVHQYGHMTVDPAQKTLAFKIKKPAGE